MNEPTVGSNEMCLDQVVPEKFEIGLGWTALSWETPCAAAVGRAFTLEGVRVDEEAVAGGEVADAEGLKKEATALEAAEVLALDAGRDETLHQETVVLALEAEGGEFIVGEGDLK